MALIEIEADDVELIPVKLVGVEYLVNPPKTSLTMGMARSFSGIEIKKAPKGASQAEKDEIQKKTKKASDKAQKAIDVWVLQAFGRETADKIQKRLMDPEDRLDTKHLMDLMTKLGELETGNPTT